MNIKQTIKKSFSRATLTMLATFLIVMTAQTARAQEHTFSGGEGTPENPFQISSAADLEQLAADVNNGTSYELFNFILTKDITYDYASLGENESNYTAIGCDARPFKGHFDGNGKTISGIRIYKSDGDRHQGLFGIIEEPAVVEKVTLTDTRITAGAQTGGIVGNNKGGIITNCHVTNTVEILGIDEGKSAYGGIAGTNGPNSTAEIYGTVSGCISEATLSIVSGFFYGGIVGENSGTLEDNFVIGATIPTAIYDNNQGAIVGYNEGTLANNYYTACTVAGVENATNVGVGVDDNDQPVGDVAENDGALSVHQILLAEGVTGVTINAEATYSYDSKDYYAPGTTVVITYSDTSVMDFQFCGINTGEVVTGELSGNKYTFTMPADDVTMMDEWGVTDGADGSEAKPYVITTPAGLDLLAKMVEAYNYFEGKYFKLGDDITYDYASLDENESNYTAIGGNGLPFEGHFDGNGKTISGIRIYNSDDEGRQGLFGDIMAPAVVENLTLTDTRIAAGTQTGGIVGVNNGANVINCHVTNTVEILGIGENDSFHGGIVGINGIDGENVGTVSGCISEATLSNVSEFSYGGIAGQNYGTLENNFVIGATIPAATDGDSHGAIVGYYNDGTLKNNYYTACTVADVKNATNVGVGIDDNDQPVGDVAANDGALSVHQITLAEGVKDVTIDANAKVYSYDSKDYYAQGTTVKLTYSGTPGTGYEFIGINAGEGVTGTLSDNVYTITMPANDVTVASVDIKAITYTITYAGVDDVTMPEEIVKEYTVESADIKLPESLEKEGYVFTGWTYEGQEEPMTAVTIAKGSTGDKTFTANWRSMEEPNSAVVNVEESVTIGGEKYYEPNEETKEKISEKIEVPVALSAEASNRMEVTAKGSVKFSKGPSATIALPKLTVGAKMRVNFDGQVKVKDTEVRRNSIYTRGRGDSSSDGMIDLVSGAEYEVLKDGDLVLTIVLEEEEAVIEGISVKEPEPEPDPEPTSVTIEIGKSGKTTYTGKEALDFSGFEDVKAYVATGFESDGTVWLTRVKQVPAWEPVLIKGAKNTSYEIPVLSEYVAQFENMFKGSADEDMTISATTADGKYQNFYMAGGVFKQPASDNYKLTAGKCYLQVPASFKAVVSGDDQKVKISKNGKSSYAPPVDVDLTTVEGLKAYAATGYDAASQTIWLTRILKIQAGEGVLLKGEAGVEYTLPAAEVKAYYGNMFVGNIDEKITINETSDEGDWTNFYLADGKFKKVSGTQEIGVNKSYLQLPTSLLVSSSSARGKKTAGIGELTMEELETETLLLGSIGGDDEDGTTRIDAIATDDAQPAVYYNLQGQRVDTPKKGLYIKDGKKVVIK